MKMPLRKMTINIMTLKTRTLSIISLLKMALSIGGKNKNTM
jgi:hypothetical protein